MGLADLHIHSIHSYDGTSTIPAILKHVAENTSLDVIAITDHDSVESVNQALDLAAKYDVQIIPGSEISSADGHVLALFIKKRIPAGLSFLDTLTLVGEQGGLAIAAHPEAKGTSSLSFNSIRNACEHPFARRVLIGIEAFNGGLVYTRSNIPASVKSNDLPLARLGNSDAHILSMIGNGASYFPGSSIADLKIALKHRQTRVAQCRNLGGFQVLTAYLPKYLLRILGWAVWNEYPSAPFKYTRINRLNPRPNNRVNQLLRHTNLNY